MPPSLPVSGPEEQKIARPGILPWYSAAGVAAGKCFILYSGCTTNIKNAVLSTKLIETTGRQPCDRPKNILPAL
jgi:hypothetical protein